MDNTSLPANEKIQMDGRNFYACAPTASLVISSGCEKPMRRKQIAGERGTVQ